MVLVLLIVLAIGVIAYLYLRMFNTGSLWYKLIFGLIIGGALSNLIDRARHGGNVVDFISFNIPRLNYHFAIFNLADAAISVGVILLFITLLFGGLRKPEEMSKKNQQSLEATPTAPSSTGSEALQSSKEHDAQN
jgi:signal peptidase II